MFDSALFGDAFGNHQVGIGAFFPDCFCRLIFFTMIKCAGSVFAFKLNHHNDTIDVALKPVGDRAPG